MAELHPFHALRYTPAAGHPSGLLAPPYDVIGEAEAEELRRRGPHNAVHLVLPEGGAPGRYALAADRLRGWLGRGILAEDPEPAAFVYRQGFELEGAALARWGLFAALELSRYEAGRVLPHEETHAAPREDRLALTLACRAQLSAVFLSSSDPDGRLLDGLRRAAAAEPVLEAETPDGVAHGLWRVEGPGARGLCEAAARGPLLVADGHHRYETALAVRRRLPDSNRAGAVLVCVSSEADPGLKVFPTHRALAAVPPGDSWTGALDDRFEAEAIPPGETAADAGADGPAADAGALAEALAARAAASGPGALGLLVPASGEARLLRPRAAALEAARVDPGEARIATVVFDRLVLGAILGLGAEEALERRILSYHRDPSATAAAAGRGGAAFLLPPVAIRDVRSVAASGRRLPPKSTYFAPKVPSGLLFRRI